jgi:hypothetical protein
MNRTNSGCFLSFSSLNFHIIIDVNEKSLIFHIIINIREVLSTLSLSNAAQFVGGFFTKLGFFADFLCTYTFLKFC